MNARPVALFPNREAQDAIERMFERQIRAVPAPAPVRRIGPRARDELITRATMLERLVRNLDCGETTTRTAETVKAYFAALNGFHEALLDALDVDGADKLLAFDGDLKALQDCLVETVLVRDDANNRAKPVL